ncbi:MAG: family 16 glycosylhydrolase, partial [Neisseria sp.]|uniref:family 16 glycosylhydrolase n=1 Tax=Neisseria sp. TaxID=192066 RepID=UPI0026DD8841
PTTSDEPITPEPTVPKNSISLNQIAGNNSVSAEEAEKDILISGKVEGEFNNGDTVNITIGTSKYETTVNADGVFELKVGGGIFTAQAKSEVTAKLGEATDTISVSSDIVAPSGYLYYGGDEFNGNEINTDKWFVLGSKKGDIPNYGATFGQPDGMLSTYHPDQVKVGTNKDGLGVLTIESEKLPNTVENQVNGQQGWSSGAFNSRDVGEFYPLYSRIDVKAKIANNEGIWHGPWLTHYKGASVAEFDIAEFFVNQTGDNVVTQNNHIHNNTPSTSSTDENGFSYSGKLDINVPRGQDRRTALNDEIDENFHIYSVEITRGDVENEAVITYLVDNKITYSFKTDQFGPGVYNKFIMTAQGENRTEDTWNIMFTGGIGGQDNWTGAPTEATPNKVTTEIDYIRVYTSADGNSKVQSAPVAINADDENNTLQGDAKNNVLDGLAGDDRLAGGLGNDTLTGGDGRDVFVFDTALGENNIDTIVDFNPGTDMIMLASYIFNKLDASKNNLMDLIDYNQDTGALTYDADGAGGAAAVQFAKLQSGLEVNESNFLIA